MAATSWVFFACIVLFACTNANPVDDIEGTLEAAIEKCRYSESEMKKINSETVPNTTHGFGNVNMTCGFSYFNLIKKEFYLDTKTVEDFYLRVYSHEHPSVTNNLDSNVAIDILRFCSQYIKASLGTSQIDKAPKYPAKIITSVDASLETKQIENSPKDFSEVTKPDQGSLSENKIIECDGKRFMGIDNDGHGNCLFYSLAYLKTGNANEGSILSKRNCAICRR
ncbi:hypothetical protein KQX54_018464 [Cotesia glomerata]|uniref:Uncharacterized protein n=1 Tax=Cotesia glomerata TaxID=32391 RepID=A0AAV7IT88_COTGL|nr:hypothetical protein KQX54_018464 [Cotesia glomerata]